ncbi:MAG TPA: hemin uptake protein HemP [Burkholderiales bacterium]|nr:hemin uptake protein HemP [Burkholderiales bacterium]
MPADPTSPNTEGNQGRDLTPSASSDPVPSRQLLGKKGELIIEHEGREYRLRRTQNGKLILTA